MSLLGTIAFHAIKRMRGKADLFDKRSLDAAIARRRPLDRHAPPKKFRRAYDLRIDDEGGHPCYRVAKKSGPPPTQRILYLHGGCYTYEISSFHWSFFAKLLDKLARAGAPAEITVPIYPLAPESDHRATFAMIEPIADRLAARDTHFVIMGDSAGGGIALALSMQRSLENKPQPRAIVVLSPWLDIALADTSITSAIEASDPMLGRGGLVAAGRYWSGALEPRSHLVSPIHGPIESLPHVALLVAGREIFMPDARRFRDRLRAGARSVAYLEEPAMFHVWPLVTLLPESRRAIDWIVNELIR